MTNREIVSKVINTLKLNNRDEHISRRYVLKVLRDTAKVLISQKWLDRSIFSERNLYTQISCFEFEQVEVKSCPMIEFRTCNVLMKSKKPLPELVFSRLGSSIKEIISLDGNFNFTLVDEAQYRRNKRRQFKVKSEVYIYLGTDNHLYIVDEEILTLDLIVLTVKPEEVSNCSACKEKECRSYWDYDFIMSDKLQDTLFQQTLQVLGLNRQIREDNNPNNVAGV